MPFLRQAAGQAEEPPSVDINGTTSGSEVFFVPETGQIYDDYEKYIESLVQKNQPVWTCKHTGKSGLTFWEALESERKAQGQVDAFPETWKAPVLRMVQHSFESPEAIATQLGEFCKGHFLAGEYVRIDINADVRYWGEVLTAIHGMRPDGSDTSEYKVSLAASPGGVVIGEASFVGFPPFTRLRSLPSKMLIKRFIRSCASRNLFPGSPWIVNAEMSKRYGLPSELPSHLADAAFKAARAMSITESTSTSSLSSPAEVDEGPRPDEDLMIEGTLPQGEPFEEPHMDGLLDIWMFCQAFAPALRLAPFSLKDLMLAVQHDELPNPLLESVFGSLLTPLHRERKTRGSDALHNLVLRSALCREMIHEEAEDDEVDAEEESTVLESLDRIKWWETPQTGPWWIPVGAMLREASLSLRKDFWLREWLRGLDPNFAKSSQKAIRTVTAADRVAILQLMIKLIEVLPLTRQHVDTQLETSLEHRKDRRQLDIDRNKTLKEIVDAEREFQEASLSPDFDPKKLKTMEAAVRKLHTQEAQLLKKSEAAFRDERKASAYRTVPLGQDRALKRYWWLDFHLVGTTAIDSCGFNMILVSADDGKLSYFDTEEGIKALKESLCLKGIRELRLNAYLDRDLELILESLRPFKPTPPAKEEEEPAEAKEGSSSEEELVVVRKRMRKAGRNAKQAKVQQQAQVDLPPFLRYRNTLAAKK